VKKKKAAHRNNSVTVAIIGTGPAGLMAATVVASAGHKVHLFEKKKGPGRKLLIAGSSGLNVTYDAPPEFFANHYTPPDKIRPQLESFSPENWLRFIEEELGSTTFKGTSRRYFVKEMKASKLLRSWTKKLTDAGVEFHFGWECSGFESSKSGVALDFGKHPTFKASTACFALGGASYEPSENPLRWPSIFSSKSLGLTPFAPSNAGFKVDWPAAFLKEAEGQPIKNILFTTAKGSRRGDLMITSYGLEGTPVYFVGQSGKAYVDLKPDLTADQIQKKLEGAKENLAPIRRAKKYLALEPSALALLYHLGVGPDSAKTQRGSLAQFAKLIKALPLQLGGAQPLEESISSSGGLKWDEVDASLMLQRFPGVFVAGEMLDWDAPTGGFLIQACVSQGYCAGQGILRYLSATTERRKSLK
jgi:uncharacterized flavoprotein (TIGR03862 family)